MAIEDDQSFMVNPDFFLEEDLLARTKPEKGWFGREKEPILTYCFYITSRERTCTVMDGKIVVETDYMVPSRVSGLTVTHNGEGWTEAFLVRGKATRILMQQPSEGEGNGKLMVHFLGHTHTIEDDIDPVKFDRLKFAVRRLRQE